MKRTLLASTFALLVCAATAFAQQAAAPQDLSDVQHIAGTILVGGHALSTLQSLTDMGPRLTGTDHYNRAAQWAVEQFRSYGIKNVRLEPFTIPHGWQRGPAAANMVAPFSWPLHVAAEGWTPSTPANGIQAQVVVVEDISPENLKAQAANLKGKIVLLDLRKMFADRSQAMNNYGKLMAAPALLQQAGVLAVLTGGRMPNNVLGTGALGWKGDIEPLPIAGIGLEDGLLVKRLIEKGPVTMNLNIQNKISGPVTVNDVVAEIPGTTSPQDWVLMGAHLDSWDFATGAQDNGSGSAQILEAARAIASLGQAPKRSIRFALWGGEEEGLIGSQAYAHNHANEMDHCIAVLNTDNGAGHPQGWKVEKRDDVKKAL